MAEPIEIPFGLRTLVCPENHVLDGSRSPMGKGNFWGKGRPFKVFTMNLAKDVISSLIQLKCSVSLLEDRLQGS